MLYKFQVGKISCSSRVSAVLRSLFPHQKHLLTDLALGLAPKKGMGKFKWDAFRYSVPLGSVPPPFPFLAP